MLTKSQNPNQNLVVEFRVLDKAGSTRIIVVKLQLHVMYLWTYLPGVMWDS